MRVCVRERERAGEGSSIFECEEALCVCVCVCARERETAHENVFVRDSVYVCVREHRPRVPSLSLSSAAGLGFFCESNKKFKRGGGGSFPVRAKILMREDTAQVVSGQTVDRGGWEGLECGVERGERGVKFSKHRFQNALSCRAPKNIVFRRFFYIHAHKTCTHTYTHTHKYTNVHTHTYTHTHAYIHIYIYIYIYI